MDLRSDLKEQAILFYDQMLFPEEIGMDRNDSAEYRLVVLNEFVDTIISLSYEYIEGVREPEDCCMNELKICDHADTCDLDTCSGKHPHDRFNIDWYCWKAGEQVLDVPVTPNTECNHSTTSDTNEVEMKKTKEKGMSFISENRQTITWETDFGQFEATIWDGKITDVRMCAQGSLLGGTHFYCGGGKNALEFVREVHKCLGELINHLDNQTY